MIVLFLGILFAATITFAQSNFSSLIGMRSNRYALIGIEYQSKYGFLIEQSLFAQDIEQQYVRAVPFYEWDILSRMHGYYALYAGTRFDQEYVDVGAKLDADLNVWNNFLYLDFGFLVFYDSYLGKNQAYRILLNLRITQEWGIAVGMKNMPEFRRVENRYFGTMSFDVKSLCVMPEVSVPTDGGLQMLRSSVSFIYKGLI